MNEKIVEIARGWLGTRFHHQGRKKGVGVDCIGLIVGVASELGIKVADRQNYGKEPFNNELETALVQHCQPCELGQGVIALFRISQEPQHVGIISDYAGGFGLIHAYAQSRKVVEHGLDDWWQKRLVGCFSFSNASQLQC